MHKDWCGKPCSECKKSCSLDESIPCSPDCEFLGGDGSVTHPECQNCDAIQLYQVHICYDGVVYTRAVSPEKAREQISKVGVLQLFEKAEGCLDIDSAVEVREDIALSST